MAQSKLLIDTNTYFRLAQSVHPLLKTPFGPPPYVLVITEDLEKEFDRSNRLQCKFGWFQQDDYKKNRSGTLQLSNKQKSQFKIDRDNMIDIANDFGFTSLSLEDINAMVYAMLLGIPLVTDDDDLRNLSGQMGVALYKTLELLKLMLDVGHITMEKVRAVAAYWISMADCPKDFKSDYEKIFGEKPPQP
ncbi:MAG: hypothetical protein AB7G93_11345 [Bdellovibrionales bacterium]